MAQRIITAVDLFCGGGGTSTGLKFACDELDYRLNLSAINHSEVAIQTHSTNHPDARHMCESLDSVNPLQLYPKGKIDLLVASPECTNHSRAKGGKPKQEQSRATAWHIARWCSALEITSVLIENVREFMDWGPLDRKGFPIKSRKGETFEAFLQTLRSLGYRVEHRILNAADYGAATSRERLFIQAHRGRKQIVWPTPTHSKVGGKDLFVETKKWRAAREIIDWSLKGQSIYERKRPLSPNTLARIFTGLQRFSGLPFIVPQQQGGAPVKSVDDPLSTITTTSRGIGVCEPFLVVMKGQSTVQSLDRPVPTITKVPHLGIAEPFLVDFYGERPGQSPRCRSVDQPLGTVTSQGRLGLCQPFLIEYHGNHDGKDDGNQRVKSVDQPLPTLDTSNRYGLAEPFLVKYYGTGTAKSVDEPLDTITGTDRFGLVMPEFKAKLDIRFRMLQPHELAAAMSFPLDYKFAGSKENQVMQIGNAVDVNQSKALCLAILGGV